jgi:hypothetical protein
MKPTEPEILFPAGRSLRGSTEGWPLPRAKRVILGRAAPTSMPILLLRATGDWFLRMAAAIHQQSGRDHLLAFDLGQSTAITSPEDALSKRATLALDGIENLGLPAQEALLDDLTLRQPRLISGSGLTLDELQDHMLPELLYLLGAIDLDVPAISADSENMLLAAEERITTLAQDFARAVPALAPSARQALAQHAWPGEDAELDGTLARTLLALPDQNVIEAEDLVWSAAGAITTPPPAAQRGAVPAQPTAEPSTADSSAAASKPPPTMAGARNQPCAEVTGQTLAASDTSAASAHAPSEGQTTETVPSAGANGRLPLPQTEPGGQSAVESIAVELAHHLKNPLVTLKTFVTNASRLGEDPEKMARFKSLAEESIGRMDATLDELMDFARLQPEKPRSVDVLGCFRAALRDVWAGLDAKKVLLEGPEDQGFRSALPPHHLTFAFRTLARYLEEAVEPRGTLSIAQPRETSLEVRFPEAQSQRHLRDALLNGDDSFPLSLLLVRGALIQGGGTFAVERTESEICLRMEFPHP